MLGKEHFSPLSGRTVFLFFLSILFTASLSAQEASEKGVTKEFLLGKTDYEKDPLFVQVDSEHSAKPLFLHRQTYSAFLEMATAAKNDGVELKILSGARNFEHQKSIWNRKWKILRDLDPLGRAEKILEFSAMPTTSRHHWGTEIDLNSLENCYFEEGPGKGVYNWLLENASRYGFHQVYKSKSEGRTGYSEEKWHWSYLPLANVYLNLYNDLVDYQDIDGFEGSHLAQEKKMIDNYVNGISLPVVRTAATKLARPAEAETEAPALPIF